jgi:sugar phosphate isomerase/epimerase
MVAGGETERGFRASPLGRRRFLGLAAATAVAAHAQQAAKPMRLGVVADCTNADAAIRRVKELGFLTCKVRVAAYDGGAAKKLRAALDQYGVQATALLVTGPGPETDTLQDGPRTVGLVPVKTREDRINLLRKASDFAKTAAIPALERQLGFLPEDPGDPVFSQCVNALWKVAEICNHNGQKLLCGTGHETPIALLRVIRGAGYPNIGVNLDPGALIRYGKASPVDSLDTFGALVAGVTASDGLYPNDPDALGEPKPVGQGRVDFPRLLARLKEAGYEGAITIDGDTSGTQQAAGVMAAKRYLEGLLG